MKVPRALRLQGASGPEDETLLEIVRRGSPSRRWWWGIRRWWVNDRDQVSGLDNRHSAYADANRAQTGAWCYVCQAPIATWSSRWGITVTAKLAVQRHRTEHIQGRLDTPRIRETA